MDAAAGPEVNHTATCGELGYDPKTSKRPPTKPTNDDRRPQSPNGES